MEGGIELYAFFAYGNFRGKKTEESLFSRKDMSYNDPFGRDYGILEIKP